MAEEPPKIEHTQQETLDALGAAHKSLLGEGKSPEAHIILGLMLALSGGLGIAFVVTH